MEEVQKLIPNRLRKQRRRFGYSLTQVSVLIGIRNPSDIGQWEQGTKLPTTINLLKLSALYRTSPNELYYDLLNHLKQEITLKEYKLLDR